MCSVSFEFVAANFGSCMFRFQFFFNLLSSSSSYCLDSASCHDECMQACGDRYEEIGSVPIPPSLHPSNCSWAVLILTLLLLLLFGPWGVWCLFARTLCQCFLFPFVIVCSAIYLYHYSLHKHFICVPSSVISELGLSSDEVIRIIANSDVESESGVPDIPHSSHRCANRLSWMPQQWRWAQSNRSPPISCCSKGK